MASRCKLCHAVFKSDKTYYAHLAKKHDVEVPHDSDADEAEPDDDQGEAKDGEQ